MENLISQYKEGKSLRQLEIELGMSRKTIKKILQKNGIKIKTKKQTHLIEQEITKLYFEGFSGKHIADKLNISPPTLYDKLRSMGLSLKNRKYPNRPDNGLLVNFDNDKQLHINSINNKKCKYYVNENFFDNIDSEQNAYLLGLWYADGNIYKNTASLVLKDKDLVELTATLLGFNGKIKTITKKNGKIYYKLCLSRIGLVKKMIDKGCMPRKSLILKFPTSEIVPENLISHFIRGLFDGDGTIFKTKRGSWGLGFIGTFEIIAGVLKNSLINGKISQHKSKKNTWRIVCEKQSEIKRVIEYMYKDSTVALKRKAIKADEFLQHVYERSL